MVDADSVTNRLQRLDGLLRELEDIRAGGHDAYMAEPRTRLAAEHALQLAIQNCIDVGAHLVSELGLEAPEDYRGVFASLSGAGLDAKLAERLAVAAGMRNILVHGYLDVDDEIVWGRSLGSTTCAASPTRRAGSSTRAHRPTTCDMARARRALATASAHRAVWSSR